MRLPRGWPTALSCVWLASSKRLRMNSNSVPCHWLEPDFKVVLTLPPPVRPSEAS